MTDPAHAPAASRNTKNNHRVILVVCGEDGYKNALRDAWQRLQLVDELHTVSSREEAISFLNAHGNGSSASRENELAAVVLDPETTGEETGEFMRQTRAALQPGQTPVIFWARHRSGYGVLEGKTVDAVVNKPMILKLIQELEQNCGLQARAFHPFPGGLH